MRRTAAAGLAVLALGLGACGGGGDRLTRAELLKQGNDICQKGEDAITAAQEKAFPDQNKPPSTPQIRAFFNDTIIPEVQKELDGLDDLKPPKDLESDYDELISDAKDALKKTEQQVKDDPEKLISDNAADPFADVNKRATAMGLTVCGESD